MHNVLDTVAVITDTAAVGRRRPYAVMCIGLIRVRNVGDLAKLSFMLVRPDDLIEAAQRLSALQSDIAAANATAARSITSIAAAAQDEVSQGVASLFSVYGQQTQVAVEQHAMVGTGQFAQGIASAASSYSSAEATNNAFLDFLLYNLRGALAQAQDIAAVYIELAQTNPILFLENLAAIPLFFLLVPVGLAVAIPFVIALTIASVIS